MTLGMRLRRWLFLWHRWLGVTLGLVFLVWFVSGVVMLYVRMPILFPEKRFAGLQPFDPDAFALRPSEALEGLALPTPPQRVRLAQHQGRPAYYVLPADATWRVVLADTGEVLPALGPAEAAPSATEFTGLPGPPRHLGTVVDIDQWTLTNSLNRHRPLHRFALDDQQGTEVYVSQASGEVVMKTTRRERVLAWFGPIVHWGAPELLRRQVATWRQTMLWLSVAGCVLLATGLWAGVTRYRARGYRLRDHRSRSPYVGLKRWHHWTGLAFGVVTLTWMISGLLYLNPGGSRASHLDTTTTMSPYNVGGIRASQAPLPDQRRAFSGGPLEAARLRRTPGEAWREAGVPEAPKEAEVVRVDGRHWYVFYASPTRSWIVAAEGDARPPRHRFPEADLVRLARAAVPEGSLVDAGLLHAYDAYYSVGAVAPKRLPVFRAEFDDPAGTVLYVDPHNGTIFRRYDRHGRVMRWIVNGLHTFDLPLLVARRPAWDLTIIGLTLGGLLVTGTALAMSWRRLRPRRAR